MKRDLRDMVVVITGASAGIGRQLAIDLHHAGARLVLSARRLERLEALNRKLNADHAVIPCDVSVNQQCQKLIEQAYARLGRIDTLVCNAGYGLVRPVWQTTAEEMDAIFATNVRGTSECVRHAVPLIRQQPIRDGIRGQLVIVSSAAARRGMVYFGAYSATKAAQLSLAEALRVELEPMSIAVSSVHPIGTATDFFDTAETISQRKANIPGRTPFAQGAEQVSRAIVRAIRRPRREVWPFKPARAALSLVTLWPWLGDRFMRKMRQTMDGPS